MDPCRGVTPYYKKRMKQLGARQPTVPEVQLTTTQQSHPTDTVPVTLPEHCDTYSTVDPIQPLSTQAHILNQPPTTQAHILDLSLVPEPSPLTDQLDISLSMFEEEK